MHSRVNGNENISILSMVEASHMMCRSPKIDATSTSLDSSWSATAPIALARYSKKKVRKLIFVMHYTDRSDADIFSNDELTQKTRSMRIDGPQTLCFLKDFIFTLYFVLRQKEKFDLYVGVDCLNAFAGLILRKMRIVRCVIFYVIDYVPMRFTNPIENAIYHVIDRICIFSCDFVWNLSRRMFLKREKQGVARERNLHVPVGIDTKAINVYLRSLKTHAPVDRKLIYLGAIERYKGVQLAVEAMPYIVKNVPNAKLIVIGGGSLLENLKAFVKKEGLERNVDFLGPIPYNKVLKIYAQGGIGVAPFAPDFTSIYADPTKVKEYLAFGLPVIVTSVPDIAHEIKKYRAGLVINYSKEEFIEAAQKLLLNNDLFYECKMNSVKLGSKFDWNKIYDEAFTKTINHIQDLRHNILS